MFNLHRIASVLLFVVSCFFIGCDKDEGNPVGPDNGTTHKDTSIFIGTWVSVFDTTDNPPGDKESKLMYWCQFGDCLSPDTFFFNDSIRQGYSSGFQYYYSYSSDSIKFFSKLVGSNELVYESSEYYLLSNDTLYYGPDTTYIGGNMYVFYPVFFRICDTIIPPKVVR